MCARATLRVKIRVRVHAWVSVCVCVCVLVSFLARTPLIYFDGGVRELQDVRTSPSTPTVSFSRSHRGSLADIEHCQDGYTAFARRSHKTDNAIGSMVQDPRLPGLHYSIRLMDIENRTCATRQMSPPKWMLGLVAVCRQYSTCMFDTRFYFCQLNLHAVCITGRKSI